MPSESSGWLSAPEAAEKYRINYNLLRTLVRKGVFTRGNFGAAEVRPHIYLRVTELDAYEAGGVPAVKPVKAAFEAEQLATSSGGK